MSKLSAEWAGSITLATHREQDLIPAFEGVLDVAGVEYDRPPAVDKLLLGQGLTDEETEEVAYYLNETLVDQLEDIAPEGTYFGSHVGDGANFGFWEMEEEEKRMRKSDLHVGDQVKVKERVEGYYSNYGGNPAIWLEPGTVAVVGAVNVPSVCRENVSFVCVDFFCPATGRTERAAVYYPNLCKI